MRIYKENNKYNLFTKLMLKVNKLTINIQDYSL